MQIKKYLAMSLVFGALIILYNYFPQYGDIIIFSSIFGLALNRT